MPRRIAILGAGFAGICAAIRLRAAGFEDLTLFERAADVGGTWRENTYPGCACDIPSHLYSFSFAPNPEWTRMYPRQAEIWDYLRRIVDRYGLRPRIRFGTEVVEARWDAGWTLRLADGREERFDVVVSAIGFLSRPKLPQVAGLDAFEGPVFHSAQWRHDVDLAGKRVAVVGTGASAVQIVPEIARRAARVTVWQRTPPWVVPRADRAFSARERAAFRRFPLLARLLRWRIYARQELLVSGFLGGRFIQKQLRRYGERMIARQVGDPALRARLTPDYVPGCKRIIVSSDWYPALQRDNVELVSEAVAKLEGRKVAGVSGATREADVVVLATGFDASGFLGRLQVFGRDGCELGATWKDGAATHLGISVAGFPNWFLLVGPNTGLGHNSIVFMIEAQVSYLVQALRSGARTLEVRPEAQAASYAEVQRRLQGTVWLSGCRSWYLTEDGRNDTLWPGSTIEYWWRTRRFDAARYSRA